MYSLRTDTETGNAHASSRRRVDWGWTASYLLALLLLLGSFANLAAAVEDDRCTVKSNTTNKYYNLQKLMRDSGDWKFEGQDGDVNYTFYLNVCGQVVYDNSDIKLGEMGAYMLPTNNAAGKSLGAFTEKPELQGEKLVLKYERGSQCHRFDNVFYTTLILFTCDNTVAEDNLPVFLGTSNDCGFFFEWRTPFACATTKPGDDGKSGWNVFFTIFTIAILVYVICGVVYNRAVHSATGISQLPNAEFWGNAWDFVKDMSLILIYQLPCFKPAVHTRSYRNLPRDEEAELIEEDFGERS